MINESKINEFLMGHRLKFDNGYKSVASEFCNLEGFKKNKTKERALLGNWYEGYLYTALLAIRLNLPREDKYINEVEKANKWSSNYIDQYKFLISKALEMDGILVELGINDYDKLLNTIKNYENLNNKDEFIFSILNKLKNIVDGLSNAGLKYLNEKYQEDPSIFDRHDSLKEIMLED